MMKAAKAMKAMKSMSELSSCFLCWDSSYRISTCQFIQFGNGVDSSYAIHFFSLHVSLAPTLTDLQRRWRPWRSKCSKHPFAPERRHFTLRMRRLASACSVVLHEVVLFRDGRWRERGLSFSNCWHHQWTYCSTYLDMSCLMLILWSDAWCRACV